MTVWIEGSQIDTQLRPGQLVGGTMVVKVRPDTLAVPESAIVYDSQEHPYLFVRQDSSYEPLSIQVGLEQDGWVEVLSGLKQDQIVVTQVPTNYSTGSSMSSSRFRIKPCESSSN